jgi:MerR family transcriptional regulator, light-induced transcriptional regulator
MANSVLLAPRQDCERCEDYGLAIDLIRAETVLVTKAISVASAHLDELASTIESAIIPRLLVSHGARPALNDRPDNAGFAVSAETVQVSAETIQSFTELVFSPDNSEAIDFIEDMIGKGLPVERVMLGILAPSARLMGDMWTADLVSFVDVTLGLSRIQQILRQLRNSADGRPAAEANKGRALLVPAPGEQHTFGLRVVEEFLLRDGWDVRSNLRADEYETLQLLAEEYYDFVGFSISGDRLLPALQSVILKLKRCSRNRSIRVLVGGVLLVENPEFITLVDADAVVADAQLAVSKANEWYMPMQMN